MQPKGEKTRKAVRWISAKLAEEPDASLHQLIMHAITNFDLNPRESEELIQFYRLTNPK